MKQQSPTITHLSHFVCSLLNMICQLLRSIFLENIAFVVSNYVYLFLVVRFKNSSQISFFLAHSLCLSRAHAAYAYICFRFSINQLSRFTSSHLLYYMRDNVKSFFFQNMKVYISSSIHRIQRTLIKRQHQL